MYYHRVTSRCKCGIEGCPGSATNLLFSTSSDLDARNMITLIANVKRKRMITLNTLKIHGDLRHLRVFRQLPPPLVAIPLRLNLELLLRTPQSYWLDLLLRCLFVNLGFAHPAITQHQAQKLDGIFDLVASFPVITFVLCLCFRQLVRREITSFAVRNKWHRFGNTLNLGKIQFVFD